MGKVLYIDDGPSMMYQQPQQPQTVYVMVKPPRRYGFFRFLWDCFMTVITGGLWLIWIFIREMRRR